MRERENHLELLKRRALDREEGEEPTELVQATNDAVIRSYDDVYDTGKYDEASDEAKNSDSDYEYVHNARSSSPECDGGVERGVVKPGAENPKSDDYPNGFRSSLPYCGSETESEIYSPYSFYSSNDAVDSAGNEDYGGDVSPKATTSKLRLRKGRSVVHKNLEDNYGAVVIANHEALAQVLEQVTNRLIVYYNQSSAGFEPTISL